MASMIQLPLLRQEADVSSKGYSTWIDEKILTLQAIDPAPNLLRGARAAMTSSVLVSSIKAVHVALPNSQSSVCGQELFPEETD